MSESAWVEDTAPEITLPSTQDELPCDDGIPMETERHKHQMDLLIYSLRPWLNRHPEGGYVGGNMFMEGVEATWLRWATLAGELLPTPQEALETATRRAEEERQRAESEARRAAAAEAEVARLQALLAESKGSSENGS